MKRLAINGFGRIGRACLKIIVDTPGLEVVAVNDLMRLKAGPISSLMTVYTGNITAP